jgi:hypothetical protein
VARHLRHEVLEPVHQSSLFVLKSIGKVGSGDHHFFYSSPVKNY